jgi:hypothetical protein
LLRAGRLLPSRQKMPEHLRLPVNSGVLLKNRHSKADELTSAIGILAKADGHSAS